MKVFPWKSERLSERRSVEPLDALLWHWLAIGAMTLWMVPVHCWHLRSIGWLPWWTLAVPLVLLATRAWRRRIGPSASAKSRRAVGNQRVHFLTVSGPDR